MQQHQKFSSLCKTSPQLGMAHKHIPRPATSFQVGLKGKEESHKDFLKNGLFKSSVQDSSGIKKVVLVTLVLFFGYLILKQLANGVKIPGRTRSAKHFETATTGSRADWQGDIPTFCKRLIANPTPQIHACKRDPVSFKCRESGELIMFSQFRQDYYFFTAHFSKLKRPGIYLDVAANDPFHYSNTFFMDRCLGWKGICVEGNPAYHETLYRERSCHLVPTCVGSHDGEYVMFALGGGSGGIVGDTFKNAELFAKQNKTVATIREKCTTMRSVLNRTNIVSADYMSLDVEGHELQVLRGFDWDRIKINVISVETSADTRDEIEIFFTKLGYKKHIPQLDERTIRSGLIKEDLVFLHKDVVFGSPV